MMVRKKSKITFWIIVTALFIWFTHELAAQDAVEVFQDSRSGEYEALATVDDQQDMTLFFVCRELDRLNESITELRAWIWKLALLVGGGGAVAGGGGVAAARIRKRGGG
jgi:hypothetical protein